MLRHDGQGPNVDGVLEWQRRMDLDDRLRVRQLCAGEQGRHAQLLVETIPGVCFDACRT